MNSEKSNRQVARWLIAGVIMIVIQILIGGITRLTESGLSITEWKPVSGALPPLNEEAWITAFEKYKATDQYKYLHQSFTLSDFKYIFFWEWFHRLWARLLGVVFLAGFIYFLMKKKLSRQMIFPMVVLFLLGALQGFVGWIMVKSGLVPEKYFVGHVELTTHLMAALILLAYTLWFALSLMPSMQQRVYKPRLKPVASFTALILFIQLIYGGFMAGLKAAVSAPTWPHINGKMVPSLMNELDPAYVNLFNNPITVQFIHRGTGYLFLIAVIVFYFSSRRIRNNDRFRFFSSSLLLLVCLQVLAGIFSLLNATNENFIWLASLHQLIAMLIVICMVCIFYLLRNHKLNTL